MDQIIAPAAGPHTEDAATGRMAGAFLVIDDFLPAALAEAMRADIDRHFANPYAPPPPPRDVWEYWFVPGRFMHLKTEPHRVIDPGRVEAFKSAIQQGLLAQVGANTITRPLLNYFFPGCHLDWHTDGSKGSFAVIYSLTRAERRTLGGETLILRAADTTRPVFTMRGPADIYDSIEPKFNRLLIIDQRVPHAVSRLVGSMDPADGRYVIAARVGYGTPAAEGALDQAQVMAVLGPIRDELARTPPGHRPSHGPLGVRLDIGADGTVTRARALYHRVCGVDGTAVDSAAIAADKLAVLRGLHFPVAAGPSLVRFLIFVGRVPDPV